VSLYRRGEWFRGRLEEGDTDKRFERLAHGLAAWLVITALEAPSDIGSQRVSVPGRLIHRLRRYVAGGRGPINGDIDVVDGTAAIVEITLRPRGQGVVVAGGVCLSELRPGPSRLSCR
jgi:hypothetical protein